MTLHLTTLQIALAVGALLVLLIVWRAGTRKAKRAADAARAGARGVSLAGRVLVMAAGMGGVQWLAFTHSPDTTLRLALLAVPDLIAAFVLARALTVTDFGTSRHRRDRR